MILRLILVLNYLVVINSLTPTASKLQDVDIGPVNLCTTAASCTTMSNPLSATASQTLSVSFGISFTTVPFVVINPTYLATVQLSPLSLESRPVPGSISLTQFTAFVARYNNSLYTNIILQYLASANQYIIAIQTSISAILATGFTQTVNFPTPFTSLPYVTGYSTYFNFQYSYDISVTEITTSNYKITGQKNDFTGQLTFTAVIINSSQIATNQYIGAEVQNLLFTLSTIINNQSTYPLQFCINYASNQLFFGLTTFYQGNANKSTFQVSSQNFKTATCSWVLTFTTTEYLLVSKVISQITSFSLLTCPLNYYQQNRVCYICHYSCSQCTSSTLNSCLSCPTSSFRTISSGICVCNQGYYDDGSNAVCKTCSSSCQTCSGSPSSCSSCDLTNHRTLSSTTCICQSTYYDDGTLVCKSCSSYCYDCNGPSASACNSCNSNQYRTLNGTKCDCSSGYYDVGSLVCQGCSLYCQRCNGTSSTDCIECYAAQFRLIDGTQCKCQIGYYDDGSLICKSCHSTCQTCTGSQQNQCSSCYFSQDRILNGTQCRCMSDYIDDGTDVCKWPLCDPTCKECSGSLNTQCLSCDTANHRILQGTICICAVGYYTDGTNAMCDQCDNSCKDCSGPTSNQCTDCYSQFQLNNSKCDPIPVAPNNSAQNQTNINNTNSTSQNQQSNNDNTSTNQTSQNSSQSQNSSSVSNISTSSNQTINSSNNQSQGAAINSVITLNTDNTQQNQTKCDEGVLRLNQCLPCYPLCKTCTGPLISDCLSCRQEDYMQVSIDSGGVSEFDPRKTSYFSGQFQKYNCLAGLVKIEEITSQLTYIWKLYNDSYIVFYLGPFPLNQAFAQLEIPPNIMKISEKYQLEFTVNDVEKNSYSKILKIKTFGFVWSGRIIFANSRWGSAQNNELRLQILRNDQEPPEINDTTEFIFQWDCKDQNNQRCANKFGIEAQLNQTSTIQVFPANTFDPFQQLYFSVLIHFLNETQTIQGQVSVLDGVIPSLLLTPDFGFEIQDIFINQELIIKYEYSLDTNPDQLFYSAILYYNFSQVGILVLKYKTIKFRIWDHFDQVNTTFGQDFYFQGSIFNPQYQTPSQTLMKFKVHIPPQYCIFSLDRYSGQALITDFTARIYNCSYSSSGGLSYALGLYTSQSAMEQELIYSTNTEIYRIYEYQPSNILTFNLPRVDNDTVFLVAQIQDSVGGLTNITQQVKVDEIDFQTNYKKISDHIKSKIGLERLNYIQSLLTTLQPKVTYPSIFLSFIVDELHNINSSQLNQVEKQKFLECTTLLAQIKSYNTQYKDLKQNVLSNIENLESILIQYKLLIEKKKSEGNNIFLQNKLSVILAQIANQLHLAGKLMIHFKTALLDQTQIDAINENFIRLFNLIEQQQNITLEDTIPNQYTVRFANKQIQTQTNFLTIKSLKSFRSKLADIDKLNSITQPCCYAWRQSTFRTNPLRQGQLFQFNNTNFSMVSEKTFYTNGSTASIKSLRLPTSQNQYISSYSPQSLINLTQPYCVQNSTKLWTNQTCKTYNTSIPGQYRCLCSQQGATTVTQSAQVQDLFSSQTLYSISGFPWERVALIYIMGFFTLSYVVMLYMAHQKDSIDELDVQNIVTNLSVSPRSREDLSSLQNQTEVVVNRPGGRSNKTNNTTQQSQIYNLKNTKSQADIQVYQQALRGQKSLQVMPLASDQDVEIAIEPNQSVKALTNQNKKLFQAKRKMAQKIKFNLEFSKFLIVSHPLTNWLTVYDRNFPRIVRATLSYFATIQSLAIVLFFGQDLIPLQTFQIILISTVYSGIMMALMKTMLNHKKKPIKMIGILLFMAFTGLAIYIVLAIISTSLTISQTNIWAIQYAVTFASDNFALTPLQLVLKYKAANLIISDQSNPLLQLIQKLLFQAKDFEVILSLVN